VSFISGNVGGDVACRCGGCYCASMGASHFFRNCAGGVASEQRIEGGTRHSSGAAIEVILTVRWSTSCDAQVTKSAHLSCWA